MLHEVDGENENVTDEDNQKFQSCSESLRSTIGKRGRKISLIRSERILRECPDDIHFYSLQKVNKSKSTSNNLLRKRAQSIPENSFSYCSSTKDESKLSIIHPINSVSDRDNMSSKSQCTLSDIKRFHIEDSDQISLWRFYCLLITIFIPSFLLERCGITTKLQQIAWREKIGLISVICWIGIIVCYISFIFSRTACSYYVPKINTKHVTENFVRIHGRAYPFSTHGIPEATPMLISFYGLFAPNSYGGSDATLLFQNVNGNCKGLFKPKENSSIPYDKDGNLGWYFPCVKFFQNSTEPINLNKLKYSRSDCHLSQFERESYYFLEYPVEIFFSWEDIKNSKRNLVVYNGFVIDLDILKLLDLNELEIPVKIHELTELPLKGYDISLLFTTAMDKKIGRCLLDIAKVGSLDSTSVGCLISYVILYSCLVSILSVVFFKFFTACYFRWCISGKLGADELNNRSMVKLMKTIEDWADEVGNPSIFRYGDSTFHILKNKVISEKYERPPNGAPSWTYIIPGLNKQNNKIALLRSTDVAVNLTHHPANLFNTRTGATNSLMDSTAEWKTRLHQVFAEGHLAKSLVHSNIISQPKTGRNDKIYPLLHTICFVTCYSEGEKEVRATLDSICTTDYPNSHKLIIIICDGIITGKNNPRSTPEIVLGMMCEFVENPNEVIPFNYVAVATGSRRLNMARVYAGFYRYDSGTVPSEIQKKVPVVTIVKCGTVEELQSSEKPGNRGKRDSQVILMALLQKITYNERMNELEYQILKAIWQITGLMASIYEIVLTVDADTRIYPNSITHMCAQMAKDNRIMGLCGETKIANKMESWVTMIQIFEYYIAHHQSKAFESVFGSVLCLPGCFSMYRIKAPKKGKEISWVPILANPDIVERYSTNSASTLHSKNLLLLGEDRYLSSLLLRTFPTRKQIFLPKAACKTVVPSTFRVLLSQRRRWINSTIHNLLDLLQYNNLCGTFCFSMQFVVVLELLGTVLLPFAIIATFYVIVYSFISSPTPILTLILLLVILGLPGVFIVVTTSKLIYVIWMFVYLIALPIWNLVLPSYAFWKFDDFSWGETRLTKEKIFKNQENKRDLHESTSIILLSWRDHAVKEMFGDYQSIRKRRLTK